ncbi:30S ribosomal protein S8 [Candidatus Shapirobacteria bacterium CG09_land_8_20_14_0_10_49_15]|uniref:Small ribosomal subunit protein uS8 n=1 Tax=Candidatus Shapirobacteria bacterium CG09_land_8_20_14_0_10_49_15 TaxID=1974482 RepID=A0A2M6XAW9_9BACT|nr:MAG: 30S ribosomal protein S8 [Candidatus Shapirobacteria bacterium CG09_land_8_20_14_0_10_49_15]
MTDPIADMFIRIKNAYLARKTQVQLPYSRINEAIAKVMVRGGFLASVKVGGQPFKTLQLKLKYIDRQPALTMVKRISKPGKKVYCQAKDLRRVNYGLGMNIISTSAGMMNGGQAKQKKLGGEVIGEMW